MRVVAALLCQVPKSVQPRRRRRFRALPGSSMPMVAFDWQCILVSYSDLRGAQVEVKPLSMSSCRPKSFKPAETQRRGYQTRGRNRTSVGINGAAFPQAYATRLKTIRKEQVQKIVGLMANRRQTEIYNIAYLKSQITNVIQIFFSSRNTQGEVTSQILWSRYDRHFVGIARYIALS